MNETDISMREELLAKYGPLMDAKALCSVLCFPSIAALNAAHNRGKLTLKVVTLEGRRGLFARTTDVAAYLDAAFADKPQEASATPGAGSSTTT